MDIGENNFISSKVILSYREDEPSISLRKTQANFFFFNWKANVWLYMVLVNS